MDNSKPITVTSPLLPPIEEFDSLLRDIWDRKWITNNGHYHRELERALCTYLGVEHISLFTNGTLPLITALQALRITGEVITTPYSFVATTHSLWWNGIRPVFVDVDPRTGNLDPDRIEAAITPQTTAILPVHVYGNPCDTERIRQIADKYGLKVIYDAAHAFGVRVGGESVLKAGDISTLSFHATKTYNTVEGGALVCHDARTKQRIDYLKNFGFAGETEVVAPGINSKMDEVRAAYGLLNLRYVDEAIEARRKVAVRYRSALRGVPGITFSTTCPACATTTLFPDLRRCGEVRHDARRALFSDEGGGRARTALFLSAHQHLFDLPESAVGRGFESARRHEDGRRGDLPAAASRVERAGCGACVELNPLKR